MESNENEGAVPLPEPDEESEANDGIGYENPPKDSRFRAGQSGNPKGRPPGSKSRKEIVEEIAGEMHLVDEGGDCRWRSVLELVLLSLRNRSLEGNVRAFRIVSDLIVKYEPQESEKVGGFMVFPERAATMEEWAEYYGVDIVKEEEL
jgi:hypothetical protein